MLNVLVGAVVGGVLNVAAFAIVQKLQGEPISWKDAVASFVGGAVGGALCGATLGANLLAAGGVRAVSFLAVDGAAAWGSERATSNLLEGRPVTENVAHDAAIGAIEAPLFYGATRLVKVAVSTKVVVAAERTFAAEASRFAVVAEGVTGDAPGRLVRFVESFGRTPAARRAARSAVGTAFRTASATWGMDLLENVNCYLLPEPKGAGDDDAAPAAPAPAPAPARSNGIAGAFALAGR